MVVGTEKTFTYDYVFDPTAEQEEVFREFWSNIFRNDQEDHLFDSVNIQHVNSYLSEHHENHKPAPTI